METSLHLTTDQNYLPTVNDTSAQPSKVVNVPKTENVYTIFLVLAGLLIAVENALAIAAIWRTPSLKTNENVFIVSLCFTDCSVAMTYVLYECIRFATEASSFVALNVVSYVTWIVCTLSAVHLALVAVDRAIYITKPFFYEQKITRKFVVCLVLSTWLAMTVFALIYVIVFTLNGEFKMRVLNYIPKSSMLFPSSVTISLSCVITVAAYVTIARVAVRHRRAISALQVHNQDGVATDDNARGRVMTTVKFFIVVCGAFFVSVTTFLTVSIVSRFFYIDVLVLMISYDVLLLNSGVNTLIYAAMNKNFRKAYVKIFVDFAKIFFCRRGH